MIFHCIDEYDEEIQIKKVKIKVHSSGYAIALYIVVAYGQTLTSGMEKLRKYISTTIQRYTGIVIETLEISVDEIAASKKSEKVSSKKG